MKFSECLFINNSNFNSIVRLYLSVLKFQKYNEFSGNLVRYLLQVNEGSYLFLKEHVFINVSNNFVYTVYIIDSVLNSYFKKLCYFQFTSDQGNLDEVFVSTKVVDFKVFMTNNIYTAPQYDLINMSSVNCAWLPDTAFQNSYSSEVYAKVFNITKRIRANKSTISKLSSSVCLCSKSNHNGHQVNCTEHKLGSIFPGQTLQVQLKLMEAQTNEEMIAQTIHEYLSLNACRVTKVDEIKQNRLNSQTCNNYSYTIWSNLSECELYLGTGSLNEIFYIQLKACPIGFSLQNNKKCCYCDTMLSTFTSISSCNLNDGTIVRPANSWISGATVNDNSHVYNISLHCPFDYCLPYSSHLNPSTPDEQCQYRRSGILCGQCKQGLSSVFGAYHCERCSSVHMYIIIPIMIAGITLVISLFVFNLTITYGTLNSFILYANIISINSSVFIPNCHGSFICILASLLNLDLGIKTCFYDGMNDYGKMWLQLVFPFYLFFIAIALIIGSRYSTKIQRLTAQRALPVLATIFLLSYTKILQTVSTVLFLYTSITHLPSRHTTIVWSIDANVPLFGLKFIFLFTFCLILFLVLLLFNFLLLFTRILSCKFVSTFKPLFDAYFGPYKDRYFYWTGLQLLLRAFIFGLSAFHRDINLTGGIFVLGIALCFQGILHPFKSKLKNAQELLILLNLLMVYVTALWNDNYNKNKLLLSKVLICIVLIYFVIYITYHCVMLLCGSSIKQKICCSRKKLKLIAKPLDMQSISNTVDNASCDYNEFQESLIALD